MKWLTIITLILLSLTVKAPERNFELESKLKETWIKQWKEMEMQRLLKNNYSIKLIYGLNANFREKVMNFIIESEKEGIKLVILSGHRTFKEQDRLYSKGRTTNGRIVTYVKGGESYHNFGKAIDVIEVDNEKLLYKNKNWNKIGEIGERCGLKWGGRWRMRDNFHFQELN